jgi:AcrR family transcriptional regulator
MPPRARERILISTAELFRRQGYHGTGIKEILAESGVPSGSLYHHFPGGKEELGAEVIRTAGDMYATLLPVVLEPERDLVTGVRNFFRLAGEHLEASGWQDACPIATVALEVASTSEPLRRATDDVFEKWISDGTDFFARRRLPPPTARRLAIALIAGLEGAFILARASRSVEPLHAAGEVLAEQVARALAEL